MNTFTSRFIFRAMAAAAFAGWLTIPANAQDDAPVCTTENTVLAQVVALDQASTTTGSGRCRGAA